MSIQGLFAPVRTEDMVLVDGGMRNNFPMDLAWELGADIVISIGLLNAKSGYTEIHNIADILWRGIDIVRRGFLRPQHPECRYPHQAGPLHRLRDDEFQSGGHRHHDQPRYKAAEQKKEELDAVRRWLGKDTLRLAGPKAVDLGRTAVLIDSVEVAGVSEKDAQYIRTKLQIHRARPGDPGCQVEDAVNTIFGKGRIQDVGYEMLGKQEPFHLKINCKEELVSLLLNVGFNTTAMRGSSLDLTARIGTNPYLDLHYAPIALTVKHPRRPGGPEVDGL